MIDLIDRQAVIDLLKQMRKDGDMVPWEGKDVFARIRKLPTIQPEKAQLSKEDTTSDLISREAAIDAINSWRGRFSEEYNEAIDDCENSIKELPTAQPEPTDISAKEAVYNLAEKIGIHQLFALTVELRGEPIQPEPAIPLSWIDKYIEWLKSLDNEFVNLAAAHISVMVKKWRDEQHETD